jgi:hypothetical protein
MLMSMEMDFFITESTSANVKNKRGDNYKISPLE